MDVLERARFARILGSERWTRALFTSREIEAADRYGPERTAEYLAGRFSAKEAVAKVLGVGCLGPVRWHDIEVLRASPGGAPAVTLHRLAHARAEELGLLAVNVSISHQPTVVVAFAVGEDGCACAAAR